MATQSRVRGRRRGGAGGRAGTAVAALLSVVLAGCGPAAAGEQAARAGTTPTAASAPATPSAPAAVRPTPQVVSYPAGGGNRWSVAAAEAPAEGGTARGGTGRLLRYRVAVERDIRGLPVADVAAEVTDALNHPKGWTAGGTLRLRRVGPGQPADFTIHLATPDTRDELCQDDPDGYTSCRNGDRVVLNVARWVKGVPGYGAPLAVYRRYMVNHEVGHRLGMGHELCPGRGRPAPVMQQQTLGLHGCTANADPYRGGKRYAGVSGAYRDEIPPRERGHRG
jgi:hypothetical protein